MCSAIGLRRISLVRDSGESFRTRFFDALAGTRDGCLLGDLFCRRPALTGPSLFGPARRPAVRRLDRPTRGMSGFLIRQVYISFSQNNKCERCIYSTCFAHVLHATRRAHLIRRLVAVSKHYFVYSMYYLRSVFVVLNMRLLFFVFSIRASERFVTWLENVAFSSLYGSNFDSLIAVTIMSGAV